MNGQIVCAGLVNKDNKYLMIQESKDGISGLWNLPAGRLEDDEKLKECVKREVYEESGIKANPKGIIGMYFYDDGDQVTSIIVYDMEYISGTSKPNHYDVQGAEWLTESEIKSKELRSHHINQALSDFKDRERIPCSYIEKIEDLNPGKLAKIKMKLKSKKSDISKDDKAIQFLFISLIILIVIKIIQLNKNQSVSF